MTPSRLPAILATALALVLINVGLAALIVAAIGVGFMPLWLAGALLAAGVLIAGAAVRLWRRYLHELNAV